MEVDLVAAASDLDVVFGADATRVSRVDGAAFSFRGVGTGAGSLRTTVRAVAAVGLSMDGVGGDCFVSVASDAGCAAVVLLATLAQYGAYVTLVAIFWSFGLAVALWQTPQPSVTSATVAPNADSSAAASTVRATP